MKKKSLDLCLTSSGLQRQRRWNLCQRIGSCHYFSDLTTEQLESLIVDWQKFFSKKERKNIQKNAK